MSGMNTVLAKPAQSVKATIPPLALAAPNRWETTANAVSARTAAWRQPMPVKDGDAFNLRPGNEENPGQDGSARHNGPAVTAVDGAADRIGRETGKQEPDRGCAVKVGLGPAKVASYGFGDQGESCSRLIPTNRSGRCPGL